jgi:hypothetical protein
VLRRPGLARPPLATCRMATGHKATGSNKRSKPKRRVIRSDPPSKEGVDRMDLPPARGCPAPIGRPPRASCVSSLSPLRGGRRRFAEPISGFDIRSSEGSDVDDRCCCRPRSPLASRHLHSSGRFPPLMSSRATSDDGSSASIYMEPGVVLIPLPHR